MQSYKKPKSITSNRKLSAMTNGLGLGNAYGAKLGRIKEQGGRKVRLSIAGLM